MEQSIECVRKALMSCSGARVRDYSPVDLDKVIARKPDALPFNRFEIVEVTYEQREAAATIVSDMSKYRSNRQIGEAFDIATSYVAMTRNMTKRPGYSHKYYVPDSVIIRILTRYGEMSDVRRD